ncbi:MAG: hypothetical protein KAW56_01210 [Candidatus Marinimicrobia bacterium]|nr:hypothetical protein [Candidatus Neomarinimicrobiota bacterium]
MADLTKIWDIVNSILEKCDEFVEDKVEDVFGALNNWLDGQVAKTDTKFDDNSKKIILLGIRDKLIKILPLDEYPLD